MKRGSKARFGRLSYSALLISILAATGLSATSTAMPSATDLVPNTVARISQMPHGLGTITRNEFRHALVLAAVKEDLRRPPSPDDPEYKKLMRDAIESLLEAVWLKGQAAEMRIEVTSSQVSDAVVRVRKMLFSNTSEYRMFLKRARYTRRDMYALVERVLLRQKIQRRQIINREPKNLSEIEEITQELEDEFTERWSSRTVCAPAYVIDFCSNAPEITSRSDGSR
jgi:hypothetical protein